MFGHVICSHHKLSKMWQNIVLFFGHVLQDLTYFGHVLDILEGLDMFWIHYGHFWEVNVQNVSIPLLCSSTGSAIRIPFGVMAKWLMAKWLV